MSDYLLHKKPTSFEE